MNIEENIIVTDNETEKRVELHAHTNRSAFDGVCDAKEIVNAAFDMGHRAVAITDENNVQSFHAACNACNALMKENPKRDFKVLYGCEMDMIDPEIVYDHNNDANEHKHEDNKTDIKPFRIVALVKNQKGLRDLYKLISIAHTKTLNIKGNIAKPCISKESINELRDNLLIGSLSLNGEIFKIACEKDQGALEKAMAFYDYIEVLPLEQYRFLCEIKETVSLDQLKEVLKRIILTAKKLGKIVVASGNVYYVTKDEKLARDIVARIDPLQFDVFVDKSEMLDQRFLNTKEMLEAFSWLEDEELIKEIVIKNPNMIADMCEKINPFHSKLYVPSITGSDEKLKDIVYTKVKELYGDPLDKVIADRLEKEFDAIIGNGYGVVYYISHLLAKKSNDDGYLVGYRGSIGSSLVAYMAGITEVNPLSPHYICPHCKHLEWIDDHCLSGYNLEDKECPVCGEKMNGDGHNIPFETLSGYDGDKMPDIDLNFSNDYQEKARSYLRDLFGDDYVFKAGVISTLGEKLAFTYTKSYYEDHDIPISSISDTQIQKLVSRCGNVKRKTAQHPGGVFVIPKDMEVYDFTPIQHPSNDPRSEWKITQIEFRNLFNIIYRFDIFGHVDPTALHLLQDMTGVDPKTIPMNDPKVMSLFSSAKVLNIKDDVYDEPTGACGLPDFGSRFIRDILVSTKPQTFSDLVKISGLAHGSNTWNDNTKELIKNGLDLKDLIAFRDDVYETMLEHDIHSRMAYDIMENVRKGKALTEEFEQTMIEHNVPKWYIDSCKSVKYLFPRAHATVYVMMAVRMAWYKVYYPQHYYAVYLSLYCNAYDFETMTKSICDIKDKIHELYGKASKSDPRNPIINKYIELIYTLEVCYEMKARGYSLSNVDIEKSLATEFIADPNDDHVIIPPFNVLDSFRKNPYLHSVHMIY